MKSFPAFGDSFNGCGLDCALLADDPKYRVEYEWLAHRQTSPNEFQVSLPLLALLWQILSGTGFPNQFFCDSWVVGFWRGRPWLAGRRIGKKSLDAFSSRFWIGWVTRRGDKCVHSTCRG